VEQRTAWERAGTRVQPGFQRDVRPWQLAGHAGMSVPVEVCEFANSFRDLYGCTDLARIDHEQVGAVRSPAITVVTRE
jgi:hypothetical protein